MMARLHAAPVLAAIVCAGGLAACQTPGSNDTREATAGLPDLQRDLAAHEWLLDPGDSSLSTPGAEPVTLVFDTDSVSGAAQCNSYRGDLAVDGEDDTIAITNLAQTLRACGPDAERAEREYLAALERARDVDLSDAYNQRDLVLTNDTGDRLAFTAVDAHEELAGTWYVVNVARDDAIQSVLDGTEPVLAFHDGDVTVDTGCNTVRGSFALERDRLIVDDLAQTRKQCDTPAGVMEQEAALAQAISAASQIQVVPGTLKLFDENGAILLVATERSSS